jgi:hypothetical protein
MSIEPAQLARSLGALGLLDVGQGLEVTLPAVLGSARTLLGADRVGLMLVDQTGGLRWACGSDRVVKAVAGDLSAPVQVGGDPVGTVDAYVSVPREWDDSATAALQAYAGLLASLLVATVAAGVTDRLTDQLQEALAPLPSDRLAQTRAQRHTATDRAIAVHRRDSELHEGEAQRYERGGQVGRAQTERLQAAAARGRIIDAEAERRRADRQP